MTLLFVMLLALQEAEVAPVAPDPVAQDPAAPSDLPVKKKKKRKQDPNQELPGAARPTPEDLQKKPKRLEYDPVIRVGMIFDYNDNIIRLDKRDLQQFDAGTNPDKFRIKQPQDFIYSPWAEADLAFRELGSQGRAGLRVEGYVYEVNSFATHPSIGAYIKAKSYALDYTYMPGVYQREYKNLDTGLYESGFYNDHLFQGTGKIQLGDGALFRPKAGLEIRDYDAPFQFRSAFAPFISPRLLYAIADELQPFVQYHFEWYEAMASGVQPDTSYYQNAAEVGVLSKIARTVEFEVKYRYEYRVFTTSNSAAVDPSHAGRSDIRTRIVAESTWKPLPGLSVEATYIHDVVDSSVPGKDLSNEETSWRRNQYLLGFSYIF